MGAGSGGLFVAGGPPPPPPPPPPGRAGRALARLGAARGRGRVPIAGWCLGGVGPEGVGEVEDMCYERLRAEAYVN